MAKKNKTENTEETTPKTENTEKIEEQESTNQSTEQNSEETKSDGNNELQELAEKYKELNEKYLRLSAEYDNYRKRTLKEKMDLIKNGGEDLLKNILPTVDNFERALKSINESSDIDAVKEGLILIYNTFIEMLKQRGIEEIEALGQILDTDLHEAIAQVPADSEENKGKIIDVIEKGYKLNEKILRFAKVVVAQ